MAKKGAKKTNLEANEIFLQYEEEIVNDPVYAGMPDLRHDDGTIQWEAPSNRGSGVFQFSHDKRYQWWINKASEVGINYIFLPHFVLQHLQQLHQCPIKKYIIFYHE